MFVQTLQDALKVLFVKQTNKYQRVLQKIKWRVIIYKTSKKEWQSLNYRGNVNEPNFTLYNPDQHNYIHIMSGDE